MPLIQTTGVQVVAVYATDLSRTVAFYRDQLGFGSEEAMGDGVLLKAGTTTVYVEGGRTGAPADGMHAPAVAMCLGAESIVAAHASAVDAGIAHGDLQRFSPDFAMFRVADPDGLLIEFAGKP